MKILPEMCLWTRKNCPNFRSYLLLYPDSGIFLKILRHREVGHISAIRLISLEKLILVSMKTL